MIFSIDKKDAAAAALHSADGTVVTYGQLREIMEQMKGIFCGRHLAFCLCENTPGAAAGYLGMLESRVVPLLLGADLNREQFDVFYHVYEPSFIWAPAAWEDRLSGRVCDKVYEKYGYSLWRTGFLAAPVHEKLALLLATSGSTGSPKLVRLSRENVESNARAIREYLKLDETERSITTLPMQYTYGLSILNSHLLAGGCILMTKESCVQEGFWKFFREQKATSLGGVPYTYQILKRLRFFEQEFPWLRSMTQAGGKLPADLVTEVGTWAQARGIRFYVMYGQTEATARMSYLPPEDCLKKPGSIGIPVPGGKFSLLGEDGEPVCGTGVDGELIYEGANVSLGYAKNKEDLMRGDENRGVLHTGDIARRDADGYYYIAGRKKRFIKLYGVRVSLDACEQFLRGRFAGAEFACTGTDQRLEIYGTDRTVLNAAADALTEYLRVTPKCVIAILMPEIPRNDAGKVQYGILQESQKRYRRSGSKRLTDQKEGDGYGGKSFLNE